MDLYNELRDKLNSKSAVVGIIGLGYVGLPFAVTFAEAGFKVFGVVNLQQRVDSVNRGESYITDIKNERLHKVTVNAKLTATKDQSKLAQVDTMCICVPTPLSKTKEPDLSFVIDECKEIAKYLRRGQLVILESTTYPGTTRDVVLPILKSSGLNLSTEYFLAYSPERIDPGNRQNEIKNTPKIVGGMDQHATDLASLLYSTIVDKVLPVSCPEVAEMVKVFENVFRSVNIALVNELAQLCQRMGISVWEVIGGASTKPFGYMPFYPGPGVGGHCIPLDPYYLASKARELDFHTRFIELSAEINERMPYYVVSILMEALNNRGKSLYGSRVFVLGVSYKKDIADLRESPSLKIIELLKGKGVQVTYNDPYTPEIRIEGVEYSSIPVTSDNLFHAECVVIATDHSCYNLNEIARDAKLVFDTRGCTRGLRYDNVVRLGECL